MSGHAFGRTAPFTLGVEEELLLVEAGTHRLAPDSERLLPRVRVPADGGRARHEVYAAEVELNSPICRDAGDAAAALGRLRAAVRAAGGTPMGAGIHPDGRFGDAPLVRTERYRRVGESMRGLVGRTPECALHVHVGMPDPETAIRSYNGMREHLPLLLALAANSPFWHGLDSGLASARGTLVRGFPRVGVPAALRDWAEWEATVEATTAAGELEDYTYLWWDVRPHPNLGTLEVRGMDSQSSLDAVAGLAALVHGLAARAAEAPPGSQPPREAIAESAFRSSRDGLAATLFHEGAMRPVSEVARAALGAAGPYARELGSDAALEGIERLLRHGRGADRQRAAFAAGGMPATLALLVDETAAAPA